MHIYRIQKDGTDEPIFRAAVEMYREWFMDMAGKKERAGQMERIIWKHIINQWEFAL